MPQWLMAVGMATVYALEWRVAPKSSDGGAPVSRKLCGRAVGGQCGAIAPSHEAVAVPVTEAYQSVQQQARVSVDETSFQQGKANGANPTGRKGWLWVVVTPIVCYFPVLLSRSGAAAQTRLGKGLASYVNSDRYSGYTWLALKQRQVCWAPLKRDFTKIAQRSGVSRALGEALLKQHEHLFALWHRVRDGTLEYRQFTLQVEPIRTSLHQLRSEAADYAITEDKKTPLAKTVRTCRQWLKVEPALW